MKTLQQYEADLAVAVPTVTLLGQLGYDDDDLKRLRDALRPLFRASVPDGLKTVAHNYPLSFALYLVLEGLYHYTGGDYWSGPRDASIISGNYTGEAGAAFRAALRREGLPTFENLGGHVNIAPILAHGGIPNYCLDDFFGLLAWAERNRPAADVPTLMDEWAADGFKINIDRPALRFLQQGGDMAEEFVERCLALWREEADPDSLDLPARVLERYDHWLREHPAHERGRSAYRLTRPRLIYDPYGEGMAVILPPVFYRAGQAPAGLTWHIAAGERRREETTWRRPLGDETEFSPRNAAVNILTIAPAYEVAVLADGVPLQSWTLPGPIDPPLLAFDAGSGELLVDRQRDNKAEYWIAPGERLLLFPHGWSVVPNGACKLAELPDPGGDWASFAFEAWHLEPDGRVELTGPDGKQIAFRARNDPPPARPFLDGKPLITANVGERYALYTGRPPLLHIPPGRAAHNPAKWRITITPAGAADPPAPRAFSLAELPQHCVMEQGTILLSLDAPELLGPAPTGEFHIHLRGPYGRKGEFYVRFAPGLRFEQDPPFHPALDDEPTRFRISYATGHELRVLTSGVALDPATLGAGEISQTLVVDPERTHAPLRLEALPLAGGPAPAVEFELPVYRLRFGLAEPERPDDFHWATTPLRLHPAALDAPHSALLRADLPLPPGTQSLVAWRLMAPDGRVLRETPLRPSSRHPQTGLAEWLDAFQNEGDAATLQLVMVIGEHDEATADVVRLLPTLELGPVMTEWAVDETGSRLSLTWKAAAPIRNRQVRLWPVDRPWVDAPVILPVPDEATDFAAWSLPPDRLPLGEYLAEMVIHDPWDANPAVRPVEDTPNTFRLRPDDMTAALDVALARARRDELPADEALAWVIYIARTQSGAAIARFNVTLWRERAALSMEQMLLWANAVRAVDDKTACHIVRKALFEPERIDRLAELTEEGHAAWLYHLPSEPDIDTCRALLPIATGEARRVCLGVLCRAGDETGYSALLDDVEAKLIDVDEAARLLLPVTLPMLDFLFENGAPEVIHLLSVLLRHTPNERYIATGARLWTDAGLVLVTGIKVAANHIQQEVCRMDSTAHYLVGKLWPEAGSGLPVRIDPGQRIIKITSGPIYSCRFTGQPACRFSFATPAELKRHHSRVHKMLEKVGSPEKIMKFEQIRLTYIPPDGHDQ